jgi:hypothetical protein
MPRKEREREREREKGRQKLMIPFVFREYININLYNWGKPDAIASQQGAGDPVQNSRRSYNESTELV